MKDFIDKLTKLREKIAKTKIKCESCGDVIEVIDLEQHVLEKHFD